MNFVIQQTIFREIKRQKHASPFLEVMRLIEDADFPYYGIFICPRISTSTLLDFTERHYTAEAFISRFEPNEVKRSLLRTACSFWSADTYGDVAYSGGEAYALGRYMAAYIMQDMILSGQLDSELCIA